MNEWLPNSLPARVEINGLTFVPLTPTLDNLIRHDQVLRVGGADRSWEMRA